MPVFATEQYPKALGSTVEELRGVLPQGAPVVAKSKFSMLGASHGDHCSPHHVGRTLVPALLATFWHSCASKAVTPTEEESLTRPHLALAVPELEEALKARGTKAVLLVGIEGHVCITQTALDLLGATPASCLLECHGRQCPEAASAQRACRRSARIWHNIQSASACCLCPT